MDIEQQEAHPGLENNEFAQNSSLTIHETNLVESYEQMIDVLDLMRKNLDFEEGDENDLENEQFSMKNLNKEVTQSYKRTKQAGENLNSLYSKIKNVHAGINEFIEALPEDHLTQETNSFAFDCYKQATVDMIEREKQSLDLLKCENGHNGITTNNGNNGA